MFCFFNVELNSAGQLSLAYSSLFRRRPRTGIHEASAEVDGSRQNFMPLLFLAGIPGAPTRAITPTCEASTYIPCGTFAHTETTDNACERRAREHKNKLQAVRNLAALTRPRTQTSMTPYEMRVGERSQLRCYGSRRTKS